MYESLKIFLGGVFMAAFLANGLFFFKGWRRTRDRFFLLFSLALWFLALERIPITLGNMTRENSWPYLIRLLAFTMIILAIIDKNRTHPKGE